MAGSRFFRRNSEFDFGMTTFIKIFYPFVFVQEIAEHGLDLSTVFIVHLAEVGYAYDPHSVTPLQRNTVPINARIWWYGCYR